MIKIILTLCSLTEPNVGECVTTETELDSMWQCRLAEALTAAMVLRDDPPKLTYNIRCVEPE